MTAIQFRPQQLNCAPIHHRPHLPTNTPSVASAQPKAANPFAATPAQKAQAQDTVRFSGRFYHRVADDTAIICDTMNLQYPDPPLEFHPKVDPVRLEIAHELSDWMGATLDKKGAIAAVIARNGKEQAQRHDKTGMAHSGLALYDPDKKQWMIYNLLNDVVDSSATDKMLDYLSSLKDLGASGISGRMVDNFKNSSWTDMGNGLYNAASYLTPCKAAEGVRFLTRKVVPRAQVWRSEPLEFFYEQPVNKRDALIMIPTEEVQKRLRDGILSGRYKKLYFTPKYNLVSEPHTDTSLNCNKWVLMNLLAAQRDDYCHTKILKAIKDGFKPGRILMNPLLRPIAKIHPTIIGEEVPVYGPINTVTVESLYRSDLFPQKEFFVPRELD